VCGDPTRLEQIATNLITNAVKHTPGGGRVDVGVTLDGAHAVMHVSDNGDGIAPDALPRIFDLFYQEQRDFNRPRSGLGVGLTLVRQVALLHEGTVEAASAGVGRGASFTVKFPACEPPFRAGENDSSTGQRQSRSILIVDDNADVRGTLRLVLEMEGHEVFVTADGPSALATLREIVVDIVLVDIGLPDMDGYAVARAIRAEFGPVHQLLALTGYGMPEDVRKALEAGFDEHLTKPADLGRLSSIIQGHSAKSPAPPDLTAAT
jgi:CheY-like chemotaxis protein